MIDHKFGIMGTFAELYIRADEADARPVLDAAQQRLEAITAEMTRFDPQSPIEQLNDAGGGPVSDDLWALLTLAHDAWRTTSGRCNIGIGSQLIAAGYDRDFDELSAPSADDLNDFARHNAQHFQTEPAADTATEPAEAIEPFTLGFDQSVTIADGVRLDVGGIAKGWSADVVRAMLAPVGSCLVNLGGDVSVHVHDGDEPWNIGFQIGAETQNYAVSWGGIATSGLDQRVWASGDTVGHHIIDPQTGKPAVTDILRITVLGSTCSEAEIWTKALIMNGFEAARNEATDRNLATVITNLDGRVVMTGSLAT